MKNRVVVDLKQVEIYIDSKKYGTHVAIIDYDDYEKVKALPGTWCLFESKGTQYARMSYIDEKGNRKQPLLHKYIGGPNTKIVNSNGLDCRRYNLIDTDEGKKPIPGQQKIEPNGAIIEITDDKGRTEKINAVEVHIELVDNFTPAVSKLAEIAKNNSGSINLKNAVVHVPAKPTAVEEPEGPITPVRGVSWHKLKEKYEASAYWEGKRYRLGYYEAYELELANAAVTEFREKGPYHLNEIKQKYGRKITGGK
jgi:hypothetical protein